MSSPLLSFIRAHKRQPDDRRESEVCRLGRHWAGVLSGLGSCYGMWWKLAEIMQYGKFYWWKQWVIKMSSKATSLKTGSKRITYVLCQDNTAEYGTGLNGSTDFLLLLTTKWYKMLASSKLQAYPPTLSKNVYHIIYLFFKSHKRSC